jgi:hypothetical protein
MDISTFAKSTEMFTGAEKPKLQRHLGHMYLGLNASRLIDGSELDLESERYHQAAFAR